LKGGQQKGKSVIGHEIRLSRKSFSGWKLMEDCLPYLNPEVLVFEDINTCGGNLIIVKNIHSQILCIPVIIQEGNFGPNFRPNRKEFVETIQNPPPKWIHLH
jgi:hypothetical protein